MAKLLEWQDPVPAAVPPGLAAEVGGHPLVAETLVRRGLKTLSAVRGFLSPTLYEPSPAEELHDLDVAVTRIRAALDSGERILVWGDFDVDGQTSTTLLVSTLRDLGGDVAYHIPVRETESHGMRVPWLEAELDQGIDLVVTCDTGIDAHKAVAYANGRNVDVVITDHHELAPTLPDALAVVNPHRLPADHPLASLPGVGVAYKVAESLYERAGRSGASEKLLDLVALGIVADVAVQTGDTRYLLQLGLEALRNTTRLGLRELMRSARVTPARLTEDDIGYAIGPRLNALGRLADASMIVELLTTQDERRARILASELESLNARRRLLCDQVQAAAEKRLERNPELLQTAVLVMGDPQWPAGIIGIVANRLVDRYERPVILLTTPPGEDARGSARSVEGCHITEAIATQAALLARYGGHAMAAGLALAPEHIPAFRVGVSEAAKAQLASAAQEPSLQLDGYTDLSELTLDLALDLRRLAPFGQGNPRLTLAARDVKAVAQRAIGRSRRHGRITLEDSSGTRRDALWWHWDEAAVPSGTFDLAFTLGVNTYRGQTTAQLEWLAAREREAAPDVTVAPRRAAVELVVIDNRDAPAPLDALTRECERGGTAVWAEAKAWEAGLGEPRHLLRPAETLVVWSRPPSADALRLAIRLTAPQRLILLGGGEGLDQRAAFLTYLARLVKRVLKAKDGVARVPLLAALSGHREHTVRVGLAWLAAKGTCSILEDRGETIVVGPAAEGTASVETLASADVLLRQALEDTAAFRRLFARLDVDQLVALVTDVR